jgi:hypothetical protein
MRKLKNVFTVYDKRVAYAQWLMQNDNFPPDRRSSLLVIAANITHELVQLRFPADT